MMAEYCKRDLDCRGCNGSRKIRFGIGSFVGKPEPCHICTNGKQCAGGEPYSEVILRDFNPVNVRRAEYCPTCKKPLEVK